MARLDAADDSSLTAETAQALKLVAFGATFRFDPGVGIIPGWRRYARMLGLSVDRDWLAAKEGPSR
jgi:hypothetical protein